MRRRAWVVVATATAKARSNDNADNADNARRSKTAFALSVFGGDAWWTLEDIEGHLDLVTDMRVADRRDVLASINVDYDVAVEYISPARAMERAFGSPARRVAERAMVFLRILDPDRPIAE